MPSVTVSDVVDWMVDEFVRREILYQEATAAEIQERFGDQFVYINDNGNLAISRAVLAEWRKSSEPDVVWDRGEKC